MSYCKGSLAKILIYQLIDQPGLFQEDFIAQAWEHSPLSFLYDERKKKSHSECHCKCKLPGLKIIKERSKHVEEHIDCLESHF